ncbi:MAG: 50S ribosomal protein L22 [Alphaproteobacteria bacterium]|nr:50S ribosomal protein L22 [Alphaproteobacteria bacterium]
MAHLKDTLRKEKGALAKAKAVRSSARKLNLVAQTIRGKSASTALTLLTFEKRRVSDEVKKVLQAAIANAENNHNLDVDKLYVAEAWVGRSFVMKRFHTRGRGKSAGIEKPFSNLTVVVKEREADKELSAKRARSFSKKSETKKAKAGKPAEASAKAGA